MEISRIVVALLLVILLLFYATISVRYHARRARMSPEERKAFDEQATEDARIW
jgi:hypothetical protein